MVDEQTIRQRIAEEQAKIDVPSYQDVAFDGAWKRRSNSQWGLGLLGLATGAFMGLAAPGAAMLAGASIGGGLLLKSMAIYSAIGMSAGWGLGSFVGPGAGAAASAMKEYERRQLARDIEGKIRENPEAKVTLAEEMPLPSDEKGGLANYFNWKTSLLFAAVGAITGLVFAGALVASGAVVAVTAAETAPGLAAYAMPAMHMLLGSAASSVSAVVAYSVGVGAAFGSIYGVNYPRIARKLSNAFGDMLSGKAIDAPWPKSANLPELKPIVSPVVEVPEREEAPAKQFAANIERKPNYEKLVTEAIKEADCGCAR